MRRALRERAEADAVESRLTWGSCVQGSESHGRLLVACNASRENARERNAAREGFATALGRGWRRRRRRRRRRHSSCLQDLSNAVCVTLLRAERWSHNRSGLSAEYTWCSGGVVQAVCSLCVCALLCVWLCVCVCVCVGTMIHHILAFLGVPLGYLLQKAFKKTSKSEKNSEKFRKSGSLKKKYQTLIDDRTGGVHIPIGQNWRGTFFVRRLGCETHGLTSGR
jgi:hypothetical protein